MNHKFELIYYADIKFLLKKPVSYKTQAMKFVFSFSIIFIFYLSGINAQDLFEREFIDKYYSKVFLQDRYEVIIQHNYSADSLKDWVPDEAYVHSTKIPSKKYPQNKFFPLIFTPEDIASDDSFWQMIDNLRDTVFRQAINGGYREWHADKNSNVVLEISELGFPHQEISRDTINLVYDINNVLKEKIHHFNTKSLTRNGKVYENITASSSMYHFSASNEITEIIDSYYDNDGSLAFEERTLFEYNPNSLPKIVTYQFKNESGIWSNRYKNEFTYLY